MEVKYRLGFWDLVWFNFYQTPRILSDQITYGIFLVLIGFSSAWLLKEAKIQLFGIVITVILILAAFSLATIIVLFLYQVFLHFVSPHYRLALNHDCKLSVSDIGVFTETSISHGELKWSGIVKIHQGNNYILVYLSERAALVIPKRSFANVAEADKFFTYTRHLWENSRNNELQTKGDRRLDPPAG